MIAVTAGDVGNSVRDDDVTSYDRAFARDSFRSPPISDLEQYRLCRRRD